MSHRHKSRADSPKKRRAFSDKRNSSGFVKTDKYNKKNQQKCAVDEESVKVVSSRVGQNYIRDGTAGGLGGIHAGVKVYN